MRDAAVDSKTADYLTRYNVFVVAGAGLLSAGLFYFGTGLHPIWSTLWLAPVPVLAIAPRLRSGTAFLLGSSSAQFQVITCARTRRTCG
jgi:hypothetical protein